MALLVLSGPIRCLDFYARTVVGGKAANCQKKEGSIRTVLHNGTFFPTICGMFELGELEYNPEKNFSGNGFGKDKTQGF